MQKLKLKTTIIVIFKKLLKIVIQLHNVLPKNVRILKVSYIERYYDKNIQYDKYTI